MDLDEYSLSEAQRRLKRLGVTHVWAPAMTANEAAPATDVEPRSVATGPATARPVTSPPSQPKPPAPEPSRPAPQADAPQPIPAVLRSLFHGKQSPVRTLWTYDGMFADMQQHALPGRLDMFRKIQEAVCDHLKWAKNDICAWPLDLPPEQFLHGVKHFDSRMIICFGTMPAGVAREKEGALLSKIEMVLLPDLGEMAKGDKELKNEAWKILRELPH